MPAAPPDAVSDRLARRQIPDPGTELAASEADLSGAFTGRVRQVRAVIHDEDQLRVAQVPSNLKNLNEVPDPADQARLAELLVASALPDRHRRAGTVAGGGTAHTWAVGDHAVTDG